MLTILSVLLSGLISNIPLLIKLWDKKTELNHQLELAKYRHQTRMTEIDGEAQIAADLASFRTAEALLRHDSSLDGGKFLNALRASVRPVITYLFFFLFVAIKGVVLYQLVIVGGIDFVNGFLLVWDEPTQAIFGAIMGFWFGGRMIEKTFFRDQERERLRNKQRPFWENEPVVS